MKSFLLWLPSLLLLVTNFVFGSFWLAGFYYCRHVLAVLGILSIYCFFHEKILSRIKQYSAERKARIEAADAEDRKYEFQLRLIGYAAKADTERIIQEEKNKKAKEDEEFMLLVAKGVELGVEKALEEKGIKK